MTQEWALRPGAQEHFERQIEGFEERMTAALPGVLEPLGLDLFDEFAPSRQSDDWEAYEVAAGNVVGNLLRLLAADGVPR